MADLTKENGRTTTWREWACIFGTMAESMRANTRMIRSMGLASTFGQMVDPMKATGGKESSTALELTSCLGM